MQCIDAIERSFADIDLDDSGDVSQEELRVAMKFTELTTFDGDVDSLMKEIDVNGDGTLDLYEFGLYAMNQMATLAGSLKRFHPRDPEQGLGFAKQSFSNGVPAVSNPAASDPSPRRTATPKANGLHPIKVG